MPAPGNVTPPPMNAASPIPPPPRFTGNVETDVQAISIYLNLLYQYGILQGGLLTAETQSQSGTFDPTNLPTPGSSTVAAAQTVANEAYTLAESTDTAVQALSAAVVQAGQFTISGAATSPSAVALATAQADTNYEVVFSASASTGSPASGSMTSGGTTKTTASFTPSVTAAPGGGASVTFDYIVMRNPSTAT